MCSPGWKVRVRLVAVGTVDSVRHEDIRPEHLGDIVTSIEVETLALITQSHSTASRVAI